MGNCISSARGKQPVEHAGAEVPGDHASELASLPSRGPALDPRLGTLRRVRREGLVSTAAHNSEVRPDLDPRLGTLLRLRRERLVSTAGLGTLGRLPPELLLLMVEQNLDARSVLRRTSLSLGAIADAGTFALAIKDRRGLLDVLAERYPVLRGLDMSDPSVRMDDPTAAALARIPTLQILDARDCGSTDAGAAALVRSETLKVLDLRDNAIEDGREVADALCTNRTLIKLLLGNVSRTSGTSRTFLNTLCKTQETIEMFAKAIRKNTTLVVLDFSYNNFGRSQSVKPIADALGKNKVLESVMFSGNPVGLVENAKALANGLKKNNTLIAFFMENCELCSLEAVEAIVDALCENTTLTCFSVALNKFSDLENSARAIAHMLRSNRALIKFYMFGNGLGDFPESAKIIADAIRCNETLKLVDLRYNKFKDSEKAIFFELAAETGKTIWVEEQMNVVGAALDT